MLFRCTGISHLASQAVYGGGGKGGGGGSAPTVAPTYTDPVNGMTFTDPGMFADGPSGADQLNAEIAQRQATEKAASDATTAQNNATSAQNESNFQSRLSNAVLQGGNNISQYFKDQGLDPNNYQPQINDAINTAKASVSDLDPNPMAAFPNSLGAQIINNITSGKQAQATGAISKIFSPTYAQDNIPLSAIDPAIQTVLSSQFDPLSAQLQNAQKRNTLNATGYKAALDALNNDRTSATSTLNTLGSGIINNDRSALDSFISGAKNDAAGVTLNTADAFDPTKYSGEAQNMVSRDLGNVTGDLKNAVGSTSFADLPTLLNAGGSVQGATDPTASNPSGAVGPGGVPIGGGGVSPSFIADQVLANTKRGLGTQGAF